LLSNLRLFLGDLRLLYKILLQRYCPSTPELA